MALAMAWVASCERPCFVAASRAAPIDFPDLSAPMMAVAKAWIICSPAFSSLAELLCAFARPAWRRVIFGISLTSSCCCLSRSWRSRISFSIAVVSRPRALPSLRMASPRAASPGNFLLGDNHRLVPVGLFLQFLLVQLQSLDLPVDRVGIVPSRLGLLQLILRRH